MQAVSFRIPRGTDHIHNVLFNLGVNVNLINSLPHLFYIRRPGHRIDTGILGDL